LSIGQPDGAPGGTGNWADKPGGGGGAGSGGAGAASKPTFTAKAIKGPAPEYPMQAEKESLEGTVIIGVTVGEYGKVLKTSIIQRSHADVLDNEALRTAAKWQYSGSMKDGKWIVSEVKMQVTFVMGKTPEIVQSDK